MRKQNKGSRADGGASFKSTMSPMACIWIIIIIIVIMIASTTTWRQCKCKSVYELFCWFLACAQCTNYTLGSLVGHSPRIAAVHRLDWKLRFRKRSVSNNKNQMRTACHKIGSDLFTLYLPFARMAPEWRTGQIWFKWNTRFSRVQNV